MVLFLKSQRSPNLSVAAIGETVVEVLISPSDWLAFNFPSAPSRHRLLLRIDRVYTKTEGREGGGGKEREKEKRERERRKNGGGGWEGDNA